MKNRNKNIKKHWIKTEGRFVDETSNRLKRLIDGQIKYGDRNADERDNEEKKYERTKEWKNEKLNHGQTFFSKTFWKSCSFFDRCKNAQAPVIQKKIYFLTFLKMKTEVVLTLSFFVFWFFKVLNEWTEMRFRVLKAQTINLFLFFFCFFCLYRCLLCERSERRESRSMTETDWWRCTPTYRHVLQISMTGARNPQNGVGYEKTYFEFFNLKQFRRTESYKYEWHLTFRKVK